MDPVSIGNDPKVVRKHVLSSMAEREKESGQALDELPAVGSGAGALEPRHLHREGGSSRDPPAAAEVLPEGAGHRHGVDAGMRPEAAVLENESRRDHSRGELFERPVCLGVLEKTDGRDLAAFDGDVGAPPGRAGSVEKLSR